MEETPEQAFESAKQWRLSYVCDLCQRLCAQYGCGDLSCDPDKNIRACVVASVTDSLDLAIAPLCAVEELSDD